VASGIPLERIFMIGPHGGKAGTVKIDNFTDHIPQIFEYPDASTPIPYTELVFTAVPGYKVSKRAVKGNPPPSPVVLIIGLVVLIIDLNDGPRRGLDADFRNTCTGLLNHWHSDG
jgi:hypothetical protein